MTRRVGAPGPQLSLRGAALAAAIVFALSRIPVAAAFGYLAIAVFAVVSSRGAGRLTPHPGANG
jgi:hypothetical protein